MAGKGNMFQKRLEKHHDELRWLYMELYGNDDMFAELCSQLYEYSEQRSKQLKKMDESREKDGRCKRKPAQARIILQDDRKLRDGR